MSAPVDFIIAGGGLAGLSLAYRLIHSPLGDRRMLIVDRAAVHGSDRTWCFWTAGPTPFDDLVAREWKYLRVAGEGFNRQIALDDYRYKLIRGTDFHRAMRQELARHPNVELRQGTVQALVDEGERVRAVVDGETVRGTWGFDSRFDPVGRAPDWAGSHGLTQHFKGWEIETAVDAFDPHVATLMDFRAARPDTLRFFYVLALSPRRALVEYVTLDPEDYDAALRTYLAHVLGIGSYRIVATERGVQPLLGRNLPRRAGRRVLTIGTRGGRVKPSTGYAFLRIQRDSAAIVHSLVARGHPFDLPADSRRYRWYDTLMLRVMVRHGDRIQAIMTALFENNPIRRVLRFLDQAATPAEEVAIMASLPPALFLQAIYPTRSQ